MNLVQHYLTKNDCYKANQRITVTGLMIHSTGVNNPNLSRYIDDPALGTISSGHWNQPTPGGRQVCVHGFIGKDKTGGIKTYQTLPWDMRGWHAGKSAGNNTHIGVEICEDNLQDPVYFAAVYKEAVELFAFLCKQFNLTEKNVTTHCEGYKNGIASNHADVMHWFPKHGKSIDTFRADIKALLAVKPAPVAPKPVTNTAGKYTVQNGDTLYSIATKNKLTVAQLKSLNGLTADVIKPGQVLSVAKVAASTPAPKPVTPVTKPAPVVSKVAVNYTRTLKPGLTGNDVKQLQTALNALHFKCGTPDGKYGPATTDAVKRFQSVYLPNEVDSIAGANTINKINALSK